MVEQSHDKGNIVPFVHQSSVGPAAPPAPDTNLTAGSPQWVKVKDDGLVELIGLYTSDRTSYGVKLGKLAKNLGARKEDIEADVIIMASVGVSTTEQNPLGLYEPQPHPSPLPLAVLLDGVSKLLSVAVTMSPRQADAVALWVVGTYGIRSLASDEAGPDLFPRLWISSPTKRCGKSTLMGLVEHLVPRPLSSDGMSRASLYRVVGGVQPPTILIDEADVLLRRTPEALEILNSGYKRSGKVVLLTETKKKGAKGYEPTAHPTFAACAVAGIGATTDTLADRSLRIVLERRQ